MSTFFPKQRRKLVLSDYKPKRSAAGEKRFKIDFEMPLTGESLMGMPHKVSEAFNAVAKIDNGMVFAEISDKIVPHTIELFDMKRGGGRVTMLAAAEISDLSVSRPKSESGPKDDVNLNFSVNVPGTTALAKVLHDWHGDTMFGVFEETQVQLKTGETEEEAGGKRDGKTAAAGKDD